MTGKYLGLQSGFCFFNHRIMLEHPEAYRTSALINASRSKHAELPTWRLCSKYNGADHNRLQRPESRNSRSNVTWIMSLPSIRLGLPHSLKASRE
ncbi:hypothetical protein PspLS_11560 [Pyricularia sp. CBS 133598]|nr:hypothetical protein PspLS_11560 [Pyricularia sp. CBS 133598]